MGSPAPTPLALALRRARKASGLSQAEVALAIETSKSSIERWETGVSEPRASALAQLARAYGCSPNDLLSGILSGAEGRAGLVGQVAEMRDRLIEIDELKAQIDALRQRLDDLTPPS